MLFVTLHFLRFSLTYLKGRETHQETCKQKSLIWSFISQMPIRAGAGPGRNQDVGTQCESYSRWWWSNCLLYSLLHPRCVLSWDTVHIRGLNTALWDKTRLFCMTSKLLCKCLSLGLIFSLIILCNQHLLFFLKMCLFTWNLELGWQIFHLLVNFSDSCYVLVGGGSFLWGFTCAWHGLKSLDHLLLLCHGHW